MNKTAYLVAHVNVLASPPVVEYVGLYSESGPTADMRRYRQFTVTEQSGDDYSDAVSQLFSSLLIVWRMYSWIEPLLTPNAQEALAEARRAL